MTRLTQSKHWTEKQHKLKPSLYVQTLGKPHLIELAVRMLYEDLEKAVAKGNVPWQKAIEKDLISLGEGDYLAIDSGEVPEKI